MESIMAEGNEFTPKFAPFFGMVRSRTQISVWKTQLTDAQAGVAFAVCLPIFTNDALS
jgi:hypothetical protein